MFSSIVKKLIFSLNHTRKSKYLTMTQVHERREQFQLYLTNDLSDSCWKADGLVGKLTEFMDHTLQTLRKTKKQLLTLIAANPAYETIITDVCTDARSFAYNENLVLALYTDEKLRDLNGDWRGGRGRSTPTAKCLLLRTILAAMNRGQSFQLKTYDLTLSQTQYDEDEQVEVSDDVWLLYRSHMRTRKLEKPQTRKEWMMCVYLLAKCLFGSRFINRMETSRGGNRSNGGTRCYNFQTDNRVVDLAIDLIDWPTCDLANFEPEVVQKYDLERRVCEVLDHQDFHEQFHESSSVFSMNTTVQQAVTSEQEEIQLAERRLELMQNAEDWELTLQERKFALKQKTMEWEASLSNTIEQKKLENTDQWTSLMDRVDPDWRMDSRLRQQARDRLSIY